MGIAYLYGRRFSFDLGPIAEELRRELYTQPFDSVDFAAHRHTLAESDLYVRPTTVLRAAWDALNQYEKRHSCRLRRYALKQVFERILYEQTASRYQGISPVNGLLNCLAIFSVDPQHPELAPSLRGMEAWKWEDDAEGIRYAGARSNAWDTAFVLRSALEAPKKSIPLSAVRRGYAYLRDTQMTEELPAGWLPERRDPIIGGWCFSNGQHRWAVSDCTAEALSAIVAIHRADILPAKELRISDERIRQAVEFILLRQNEDGGFGTYERRRGAAFLEAINPSEMYGSCMTERSYVECTSSCIGALGRLRAAFPEIIQGQGPLREKVDSAIAHGVALLRSKQRPDGSWAAFWGINFTYAIFHVTEGLIGAGVARDDPALERAAEWLLSKQKSDGGWGEHYSSCLSENYVEHKDSQVVMTAWALLALSHVVDAKIPALVRGIEWLRAQQQRDGSFPQQALGGVFFGTAMLDYRLYKEYFPTWALARFASLA
jgi:lanosterol synthase